MSNLRAVCLYGPKDIRVVEVNEPKPDFGEVVIKVKAASICGTDMHYYRGEAFPVKLPIIIGHEYSGVVVEVGEGVKNIAKGDRVIGPPYVGCGRCHYCLSGRHQLCLNRLAFGVNIDGCMAEYVKIPMADVALCKLPNELTFEEGALIGDMFSTAFHCIERAEIRAGDVVVIFGTGPIGLSTALIVNMSGVSRVVAVDCRDEALNNAGKLGISSTINIEKEDVAEKVRKLTNGLGADIAIDAAGAQETLKSAIGCLKMGGRLVIEAVFTNLPKINLKKVTMGELEIHGSLCPADIKNLNRVITFIKLRQIDLKPLITHRFDLSSAPQAFEIIQNKVGNPIKIILTTETISSTN